MKEIAVAIGFLTFSLVNLLFFIIFLLKIWRYHKKALPLHPQNVKTLCDGGVAQLVRASDS